MKKILKYLLRLFIISLVISTVSTIFSKEKEPAPYINDVPAAIEAMSPAIEDKMDTYPSFSDLISLRNFLNEQKAIGNHEVTFLYDGTEDILSDGTLAKMTSSISTHFSYLDNRYTLTMRKYPGEKIVEAYQSGDTTDLTADELQTLEAAKELVAYGLEQTADPWELEQFLHDIIAQTVTYYTDDRMNDFEYENTPRYLSVVGALLDGQANCQGYTDTFYTLATMAGFQVGKMSVEAPDGGHQVNTIFLNGQWYIVDVTYDDNDGYATDYGRFNMGTDLTKDYTWREINEINPIADATDPSLYYYYRNNLAFESTEDFSQMIVDNWLAYGQATFFGMVKNETNGDSLTEALSSVLKQTGKGYSYEYSYSCNNEDCFYIVSFKEQ